MGFSATTNQIKVLIAKWEPILSGLSQQTITNFRNEQNRTIKQILGHLIDSASNNTHRIIHLQYQTSPLVFPNYSTNGNNDKWIAIQNYQHEDWEVIIQLWKYSHLHLIHVINNVDQNKLDNLWDSASQYGHVSLKEMIEDYSRHLQLHLDEIQSLITSAE